MAQFAFTPRNKIVPGAASWVVHPSALQFDAQYVTHIDTLHAIEQENQQKIRLNPIDVYSNKYQSTMLNKIAAASLPLKNIYSREMSVKINPEWLTYWELYYRTIINTLQQKILLRKRAVKTKNDDESSVKIRGITYRSFHLADNASASLHSLQKALNKIEYNTGSQITWNWLATYTDRSEDEQIEHMKSKDQWLSGVDGEGKCTTSNMRAWKNKIATSIKSIDLFVSNASELIPNVIAFSLINLSIGGTAMIYIPAVADAATASMIHLFSQCFELTFVYHMVATDRLYLVGENFMINLTTKHHKLLYSFCNLESPNSDLFSANYVTTGEFLDTVEKITNMNHLIYSWRYDYYTKLFHVYDSIMNSPSAMTFAGYVDKKLKEEYVDNSDQWIAATGFNYFI